MTDVCLIDRLLIYYKQPRPCDLATCTRDDVYTIKDVCLPIQLVFRRGWTAVRADVFTHVLNWGPFTRERQYPNK